MCIRDSLIFSQNIISGTVADGEGNPLPGVSIVEKGTSNGTVSDFDGNFQLNVDDAATIVFSYIGYITQEVGASATMNVVMQEDVSKLEEVVVVGYGTQQKKTLTGAVASISIGNPTDSADTLPARSVALTVNV